MAQRERRLRQEGLRTEQGIVPQDAHGQEADLQNLGRLIARRETAGGEGLVCGGVDEPK